MIPKSVYKVLPYCYIALGALCLLVIDSSTIIFSSSILILAGLMVLWMRHKQHMQANAHELKVKKRRHVIEEDEYLFAEENDLPDHERRIDDDRDFPLDDDNGMMIPFDRRNKKNS